MTGEAPRSSSVQYMADSMEIIKNYFQQISLEVQPLDTDEYRMLMDHGLHSVYVYQETYNRAMQGIEDMLLREGNPMSSFKKNVYPEAFQAYLRRHMETLNAIEAIYQQEENPKLWAEKLADHLVSAAQAEIDAIPKKGKKQYFVYEKPNLDTYIRK